ncbi:MAG TPA: hypothetical protein VGG39_12175 [Polyangiaceae bacterium]
MAAKSLRDQGRDVGAAALAAVALVALVALQGCASHSERMLPVRTALDAGDPRGAIFLLDKEMEVQSPAELPADIQGDKALFVLDRGSIQQSIGEYEHSRNDLEAADKAIDMLDLAHDAKDSIGEYVFSGSSGKYQAPPYEKLLVNTLDMLNYLELRDLNGARVEARRLAVMQKYLTDDLHEGDNAVLGLGGMLAGLTFEESEQPDEALRWYDESLQFTGFRALGDPVRRLMAHGQYRSPRLKALEAAGPPGPDPASAGDGEIVFVVGYGRVPHKIPKRIPIGLALTWYADAISPDNAKKANELAAQGLVTWVNFPTLGPERGGYAIPACVLDGRYVQLEEAVDVTTQVRGEWKKIEGKIVVSAITRMITRLAAGAVVKAAAGKNGLVGELLSLGTQATLTVLDTPDTRSWETLPARVAIARVRVPAGRHTVHIDARGVLRDATVDVEKGGWSVVSLMALR